MRRLGLAPGPAAPATLDLAALPQPVALRVLALLPADTRLRCAEVCRAWRALVAERSLWTHLDLSFTSGVSTRDSFALLGAAAPRAAGCLEVLRVPFSDNNKSPGQLVTQLVPVLTANAATLRELELDAATHLLEPDEIAALLAAAPGLRLLHTSMLFCVGPNAVPALRKEAPFGPLRLERVHFCRTYEVHDPPPLDWPAVADGLAVQTALHTVRFDNMCPEAQAAGVAVAAALASLPLLRAVTFERCNPHASAVARLLSSTALLHLNVDRNETLEHWAISGCDDLCAALRANRHLKTLCLTDMGFWLVAMDTAAAILRALEEHVALDELVISSYTLPPEHAAAAGAALGSLIANSRSLTRLVLLECDYGDAGAGPILDALPHAKSLSCLFWPDTTMSYEFERQRLLPAVRACAPLRSMVLRSMVRGDGSAAVSAMQDMFMQRYAQDK